MVKTDFAQQRKNMVESQIRTNDVTDRRIIRVMSEIPREMFVPTSMRALAYMDRDLEIVPATRQRPARALTSPMVLAKLVQLAAVAPGALVLDVGCATGYSSAVLARLAESVVGLETDEDLAAKATANLTELGTDNAAIVTGALELGCPEEGPYDLIIFDGAVEFVPDCFIEQLKPGGKLVAVVAGQAMGQATVFEDAGGQWSSRTAFVASAPLLEGFRKPKAFVF